MRLCYRNPGSRRMAPPVMSVYENQCAESNADLPPFNDKHQRTANPGQHNGPLVLSLRRDAIFAASCGSRNSSGATVPKEHSPDPMNPSTILSQSLSTKCHLWVFFDELVLGIYFYLYIMVQTTAVIQSCHWIIDRFSLGGKRCMTETQGTTSSGLLKYEFCSRGPLGEIIAINLSCNPACVCRRTSKC